MKETMGALCVPHGGVSIAEQKHCCANNFDSKSLVGDCSAL